MKVFGVINHDRQFIFTVFPAGLPGIDIIEFQGPGMRDQRIQTLPVIGDLENLFEFAHVCVPSEKMLLEIFAHNLNKAGLVITADILGRAVF